MVEQESNMQPVSVRLLSVESDALRHEPLPWVRVRLDAEMEMREWVDGRIRMREEVSERVALVG